MKTKSPAPPTVTTPVWSSLYCRANGFLLGCFQMLIRYEFARKLYPFHLARMREFLAEAEIAVELPGDPHVYAKHADELMQTLVMACLQRNKELGEFAFIGGASVLDASMRAAGTVESDELRDQIAGTLERNGLDGAALYERFLAEVAHERAQAGRPRLLIDQFLSPAMRLLRDAISALPSDEHTCFIAMPFKAPYASYFASFYRPFANALDCTALRMWGGLSGEDYVDLMLAIMGRCGTVIADLSDANGNVIFEVGAARALNKRISLVCQRKFIAALPSNIRSENLFSAYSPKERGWPELVVLRCSVQVLATQLGVEQQQKSLRASRRTAGKALPELAPKSLP